jgi:hypothetical protein
VPPTEMSNGLPATPVMPPGRPSTPDRRPGGSATTPVRHRPRRAQLHSLDPFRFSPGWSAAPVAPSSPERPHRHRWSDAAGFPPPGAPSSAPEARRFPVRRRTRVQRRHPLVGRGRQFGTAPPPAILLRETVGRPARGVHLNASGRSDTVLAAGLVRTEVPGRYIGPRRQVRSA